MESYKFIEPTFNIRYYAKTVLKLDVSRVNWQLDDSFEEPTYHIELMLADGSTGSIFPVRDEIDPVTILKYLVLVNQKIVSSILPDEFEVIKPILGDMEYKDYIYHMSKYYKLLRIKESIFAKLAKIFINSAYAMQPIQPIDEFEYLTDNNVLLHFQVSKN